MRHAFLAALALGGCAGAISEPPQTSVPGRLVLAQDGFGVAGTELEIGFGRAREGAVTAAAKLIGRQPSGATEGPGCTVVSWFDGLAMHFRGRAFTGWSVRPGDPRLTASGDGQVPQTSAGELCETGPL